MFELVPEGFEVPLGLEHERFRLRKLTIDDVVEARRSTNVDASEMSGLLSDRRAAEREEAGVVGFVGERPPAPLRVDHVQSPPTKVLVISSSAAVTAPASSGSWPSTQPVSTSSSAP